MRKNDRKKSHLKNDKVEHTLLFLMMKIILKLCLLGRKKQLLLYLYFCILEGKKLELTFSNLLTIKKLKLHLTNLFNHSKNNQH